MRQKQGVFSLFLLSLSSRRAWIEILVAREVKRAALWGMSPCVIRCEVTESNRSTKLLAPSCGFPNLA